MRKNISEKFKLDTQLDNKIDRKQLVLEEDVSQNFNYANIISSLIKNEWGAIESYNSILAFLNEADGNNNAEEAKNIISDIVKDEYIHIGQLEKLTQVYNPDVSNIADGHDEAEAQLEDA